jgi:hypothetical protein
MRIAEIHSGDLTASCPRERYHFHRGEYENLMQTALYRGSFVGKLLEELHNANDWHDEAIQTAAMKAVDMVAADIKAEKRVLSDAVKANRKEIHQEAVTCATQYAERFAERFSLCEHIGCEIPIRWRMNGREIASHIDLLVRDTRNVFQRGPGRLILGDWKFRQDAPTIDYLSRWPQGMLYALGTKYGELLIDDFWTPMDEWPAVCWLHLPHLKVYQKKTTAKDDLGQTVTFLKGESRPDNAIVRWASFKEERVPSMVEEIMTRVEMYDAGLYPMMPTAVGCYLCPSREWCDRFDLGQTTGADHARDK